MTNALPRFVAFSLLLASLAACENAPRPDNRIKLMPAANGKGMVAVPPECMSWHDVRLAPTENVQWPQYGCAVTRNLAAQIERPEDLVEAREMGAADPYVTDGAIARYQSGKTTPFINPNASDPTPIIKMEDSRTGSGQPKQ